MEAGDVVRGGPLGAPGEAQRDLVVLVSGLVGHLAHDVRSKPVGNRDLGVGRGQLHIDCRLGHVDWFTGWCLYWPEVIVVEHGTHQLGNESS